jgi:hypothetical protein
MLIVTDNLQPPFSVKAVNTTCNNLQAKSPSFLSKHCQGNPGGYRVYFKRTSRGCYVLI